MIERYLRSEIKGLFSEEEKFRRWIKVELALMKAEAELGLIPADAYEKVSSKAQKVDIKKLVKKAKEKEESIQHDFLAFLMALEEEVGEAGRYLHYGATSSDIIDTANALLLRESIEKLRNALLGVLLELVLLARKYIDFPVMGRTHGVYAEPTSLGLKFLGFASEALRNLERLDTAKREVSFGKISGAVGNYAFIPPEVEEKALSELGLKREPVSTQIVPRDRYALFISTIALTGAFLERLATEIRHLHRTEVGEVLEPFLRRQRGSSAMPHKRNPIKCERICGMARLLRGYLISALENIALWHERDISHSSVERIIIPDAVALLYYMLMLMKDILKNLDVMEERIRQNLTKFGDFYYSEALLLALVNKGISRKEAYEWVKECAMKAQKEGLSFIQAAAEHPSILRFLKESEIKEVTKHNFLAHAPDVLHRFEKMLKAKGLEF